MGPARFRCASLLWQFRAQSLLKIHFPDRKKESSFGFFGFTTDIIRALKKIPKKFKFCCIIPPIGHIHYLYSEEIVDG